MVTLKIKGTACCLFNYNYTVVTTSHGITSLALAVIPQLGIYAMGGYKVFVYIVQATNIPLITLCGHSVKLALLLYLMAACGVAAHVWECSATNCHAFDQYSFLHYKFC